MATQTCKCGTRCAVGLLRCPRCGQVTPQYAARMRGRPRPADPLAPVAALPFKQLRARAKALGLSGAGTAEQLAARIAEHEAGGAA
jgi:hypothetical protein